MKKNVIGHMDSQKNTLGSWFRRWHILPKLICLVAALIIWLIVVQVTGNAV